MNKEKLHNLSKEVGLSIEELEQMLLDKELFVKLFTLFNSMSKRGKDATIETLLMYWLKEDYKC